MAGSGRRLSLAKSATTSRQRRSEIARAAAKVSVAKRNHQLERAIPRRMAFVQIGKKEAEVYRMPDRSYLISMNGLLSLLGMSNPSLLTLCDWLDELNDETVDAGELGRIIDALSEPVILADDLASAGKGDPAKTISAFPAQLVSPLARLIALHLSGARLEENEAELRNNALILVRALANMSLELRITNAMEGLPVTRWQLFLKLAQQGMAYECPRIAPHIGTSYFSDIFRLHVMQSKVMSKEDMIKTATEFAIQYVFEPLVAKQDGLMRHDGERIFVHFNDGTSRLLDDFLIHEVGIEGVVTHLGHIKGLALGSATIGQFSSRAAIAFPVLGLREDLTTSGRGKRNRDIGALHS